MALKQQELDEMELHERLEVTAGIWVLKVETGYVYEYYKSKKDVNNYKSLELVNLVFVPEGAYQE